MWQDFIRGNACERTREGAGKAGRAGRLWREGERARSILDCPAVSGGFSEAGRLSSNQSQLAEESCFSLAPRLAQSLAGVAKGRCGLGRDAGMHFRAGQLGPWGSYVP